MDIKLKECLENKQGSYILPFLWLHGESKERIKEEILAIKNSGIKEFCAESRPYEEFCKEQWWEDFGFILKTASNQSYAWDAEILGSLLDLCDREGIPVQRFVKHSNVKGGGTIASVSSSHLPMRTADLGVGLLAMHSSCEMTGVKDQVALAQFAKAFFE